MRHASQRSSLLVRALALALLGLAAGGVQAQRSLLSQPSHVGVPSPLWPEAGGLVRDARAALRKGQYERARELAEEGKDLLNTLGGVQTTLMAREILAETAVLQNRPTEALVAIAPLPAYLVAQRLAMTKALALIELGNVKEARALVLREVGTPEQPWPLSDGNRYLLPVDVDASAAALTATAYEIRASWRSPTSDNQETVADLRAALRLEPNDLTVHLRYAEALIDMGAYDEANAELDKASASKTGAGADPRFQTHLQIIRDRRLQTMKQFPNGRPKPDAGGATNAKP